MLSLAGPVGTAGTVLASNPINPHHLLDSFGLAGLIVIIFAECGLLVGFFLPGDTLLFAAGLLLATG
jgi:membrane-associated protein